MHFIAAQDNKSQSQSQTQRKIHTKVMVSSFRPRIQVISLYRFMALLSPNRPHQMRTMLNLCEWNVLIEDDIALRVGKKTYQVAD